MATVKLMRSEKDKIIESAVDDALAADALALKLTENALVERVVELVATAAGERDVLERARTLPARWLHRSSSIHVRVRGTLIELSPKHGEGVPTSPLIPSPITQRDYFSLCDPDPLAAEVYGHYEARIAFKEREKMLRAKVVGVVERTTTASALAKLWPEGEPYYRDALARAATHSRNLPAVNVGEVNALLGLPKEVDRAA